MALSFLNEKHEKYVEKLEKTWGDESGKRVERGEAVTTTVTIETEENKPIARMNLYGPQILLGKPLNTPIRIENMGLDNRNYGTENTTLETVLARIPPWALDDVYIGDVIVIDEDNRSRGIGTSMVEDALRTNIYKLDDKPVKKVITGIGITENPMMISVAKKLGGGIVQDATILKASHSLTFEELGYRASFIDFTEPKKGILYTKVEGVEGKEQEASGILLSEIKVDTKESDVTNNIGFSIIYDTNRHITDPKLVLGIVIPERKVHTVDRNALVGDRLIGQMVIILNPELNKKDIKKNETTLARLLASHRWGTIIKRGKIEYSGEYLKTYRKMKAFEIPRM